MKHEYEEKARVFKALSDERRLRILELLHQGEKCTCVLTEEIGMPQSSLSYHMKILCEAGLVAGREDGKWTHYQISRQGGEMAFAMLRETLGVKDEAAAADKTYISGGR